MKFDADNQRLILIDGWSVPLNRLNEFDVPRDRIGNVTLLEIKDLLKEVRRNLAGKVDNSARVVLTVAPMSEIRVYDGPDEVCYELFELTDEGDLSLTFSVDYARFQTEQEVRERLYDHIARTGVKLSIIRFCGPASSIEFRFLVPLHWSVIQCAAFADSLTMVLQNDRVNLRTPSGAYALISAGVPALMLGKAESEWLEVKRDNYGIAAESQKYEFACDVASFANSEAGGLIVVGIASEKDNSGNDVLARITPCRRGSINVQRYMQALQERVVPPVEGLRLDVISIDSGDMMVIYIPPQPEEIKPFIVKGAVVGSKVSGSFFSIPQRRGSSKWAMSPEAVHSMLVAARVVLRGKSGPPD
ncbi:AlbA family DNA-binding domain-containing protein [Streptomyces galilaeus]|uniref:AlbA family DNA-binding domain-containing protein n=1 Tax=Streptomyces galilaeus TaxID=33899 RepID=UPI0038F5D7DB